EFELLAAFARRPGVVLSRDQLRNLVSGRDAEMYDRSIDMLVLRVRRKIEPNLKSPRFILTAPGAGYKFAVRVERAELAVPMAIGQQLDRSNSSAHRAERRQLTTLACRIADPAESSTQRDPEDQMTRMESVHRAISDVVQRFRGVVVKTLGTTLLIYFGYPHAQEDDAERAVRTGLALIDVVANLRLAPTPHIHIGISSGLVVVGPRSGPAPPDEYAAIGDALDLSLSLQVAAPPDSVVVCATTRNLAGDFFTYKELEPLVLVEGLAPASVWHVTGESTNIGRFEALRRLGMSQFVGRKEEMELLRRCWLMARNGAGQIVVIVGEPGIGKSRILHEL